MAEGPQSGVGSPGYRIFKETHLRRHTSLTAILAVLALAAFVFPSVVGAAAPKKGGAYVGELSGTLSRGAKRVVLKVSSSGKTGRVRLECSGTRFGVSSKFSISKGKFTAKKTTGSLLVWRLQGGFSSNQKAKAKLYLPAACDGKGGKITLTLA
jgi:hypothetical protein